MERQQRSAGISVPGTLSMAMIIVGGLSLLAGIFVGLLLWEREIWFAGEFVWSGLGPMLISCLCGAAVCLVLLAGGFVVHKQQRLVALQGRTLSAMDDLRMTLTAKPVGAELASSARPAGEALLQQILDQLAELNVNLLMTDEQRQAKHNQQVKAAMERLTDEIERAITHDQFSDATAHLNELARLAPDSPEIDRLRDRIAAARKAAEVQDVEDAILRSNDLMAVAAFEQAEKVAQALVARHPGSAEASALLGRVVREGRTFTDEQRRRMYADIQRHANARQWRKALVASQNLLEKHPNSVEADTVRVQLETLRDNARIEEVRELRDSIRDLIGRKRFVEAVTLAEDVIRRFPETTAAEELRSQLGRLQERAKAPEPGQPDRG